MRLVVLLLALAVPTASAGAAPVISFLADDAMGPAAPGIMHLAWPEGNDSSVRPVLMDLAGATCFQYVDEQSGEYLRGPLFVGLWPDAAVAKESSLLVEFRVDDQAIAEQRVPLDIDPEEAPDPTSFVPPDPTKPDGAVMHVVSTAAPLVLQPPTLVNFGYIDMQLDAGSKLELCMSLESGEIPTPATMAIKYDGLLTPSYVYMPFWSADPYAAPPQVPDAGSQSRPGSPYEDSGPDYSSQAPAERPASEDSPGFGLAALLGAVLVAFLVRKR